VEEWIVGRWSWFHLEAIGGVENGSLLKVGIENGMLSFK